MANLVTWEGRKKAGRQGASLKVEDRLEPRTNRLLGLLADADRTALMPMLRRVHLGRGTVVQEARASVGQAYFPISCVVSLLQPMQDGALVEVACVGPEGMVGGGGLILPGLAEARGLVQVAGEAWSMELTELRPLLRDRPAMAEAFQRFQALLLIQVMQTAGCNQFHSAGQRMARWLLTMFDRAGTTELALTHEFVAEVLAIRRPTVTALAQDFRRRGALEFRRGRVRLCDAPALREMSCECHARLRAELARIFGGAD